MEQGLEEHEKSGLPQSMSRLCRDKRSNPGSPIRKFMLILFSLFRSQDSFDLTFPIGIRSRFDLTSLVGCHLLPLFASDIPHGLVALDNTSYFLSLLVAQAQHPR